MRSVRSSIRGALLSAAIALPFVMAVTAAPADAGERSRKVVRTGPNGQQVQATHNRSMQNGQYSANSTWTGPNGKTATRNTTGQYDAEAGKWTRDTQSVGPNGATSSTHAEVQRTESGYSRDVTHTGPSQETQSHADFVRTEDGFERNKAVTGPNGKTSTSATTLTRTDDGYVRDRTVTGPHGKTMTQHTEANYDADTHTATRIRTTTGPTGQTVTQEVTRTVQPAP